MKEEICRAFCDSISVRTVPAGLALSTTTASINGDPIGFYAIGPLDDGRYRLEDSGQIVPFLYAVGADLENEMRRETFDAILAEGSSVLDTETLEIVSEPILQSDLPSAAVRFVSLLLRVGELANLTQERVANTFKHDATNRVAERLAKIASDVKVRTDGSLSESLADWEPDLVIETEDRSPVALFLIQTDHRALEARLLQADADRNSVPVSVVGLLERESSVGRKTKVRLNNRLDAVPIFGGDEESAINRVAIEALGRQKVLH